MSNMSYCRFENTLGDLRDCETALADNKSIDAKYELPKAVQLIMLCQDIAKQFEDMNAVQIQNELESWKKEDENEEEDEE